MLKRLSHVCLGVADIDDGVAFYGGVLGARIAHEFRDADGKRYGVMLACGGGTFIELFRRRVPAPADAAPDLPDADPPSQPDEGFRHLCLEVDDIEEAARRLRALGRTCDIRRGRTDRVLQLMVRDPDGVVVEFHQHDAESLLRPWVTGSGPDGGDPVDGPDET